MGRYINWLHRQKTAETQITCPVIFDLSDHLEIKLALGVIYTKMYEVE